MSPDVYPVGIEHRSRPVGGVFLIDPAYVITAAHLVSELWDAGDTGVELRIDGAHVPAEVIEVRPEAGLALIAVTGPLPRPAPVGQPEGSAVAVVRFPERADSPTVSAETIPEDLGAFQRFQAARLRADLGGPSVDGDDPVDAAQDRAGLLLAYLMEKAASGWLEHGAVIPAYPDVPVEESTR